MTLQTFQQNWKEKFPQLSVTNCRLLLTVSGGVDSVVLVDLIHRSGFEYTIAHCNFQLRGSESERDELFVRSLGEKYRTDVAVKKFATKEYAAENKISIQEAARDLRYEWFTKLINESASSKQNFILTAHHADDNIETLLMHFFRGTGIQGMMGIQPFIKERKLIRPLLDIRKEALLTYAKENELAFVEDSSNASDKYTRNFFRNQLLPQIKEVYPQVETNLLYNIDRFHEIAELYQQSVDVQSGKLLEKKDNEWHVPVLKWKQAKPLHTITWELIKPFGFNAAQTDGIIKLLDAENGSYQSSATHRIIRNRKWMIISPKASDPAQHILIEKEDSHIVFEGGFLTISLQKIGKDIPADAAKAYVDAANISFPLLLRKPKTGDYFYPLGMQKKKKLSRFLIDLKLSKTEKEKVWVLESDRKIIWVIGYRIDHRFRITANTKEIAQISYGNTVRK